MGLFQGLDLQDAIDDNPFEIPTDWYDLVSSKVEIKPGKKDASKKYLVIEWTIQGGEKDTLTVQDWKWVPDAGDQSKEAKQARYFLANRLAGMGIPDDKMDEVEPDDLMNIEISAMLVKNGDFTNFSNKEGEFKLRDFRNSERYDDDSDGMGVFAGDDD